MSLPRFDPQAQFFSTTALTGRLFPAQDRYRLFAELIYPRLLRARAALEGCYCAHNGRPGIEPVLLLGVSLLQFLDGVPDRQALELLRYHAGWNFALNRPLGEGLFHPTSLVSFRYRLIEHQQSALIFAQVLEGLTEAGLVERRAAQRLDSTHILGLLSQMSRLECMRETLRLVLQELDRSAEAFAKPAAWPGWWERYVQSKLDYRTEVQVLKEKMDQSGLDAVEILDWVSKLSDASIPQGPQIQLLGRVLSEQFERLPDRTLQQRAAQPTGAVHNPHEPQAQWAAKGLGKRKKEYVGYKVQVAETVVEQPLERHEPTRNFLVGMATQGGAASDEAGAEQLTQEQTASGLAAAPRLYVDGAYVSAAKLVAAQAQGQELIGPAQTAPTIRGKLSSASFDIAVEQRRAVCAGGKLNAQCSRLTEAPSGKVSFRFEWSRSDCQVCPLQKQCLAKGQTHRTLVVGQHHTILQARRREQQTEGFKKKVQHRNAIEGTHSELVRAYGLRRARYRGLEKVRLQNYLIGAACNAQRWIRRQIWELKRAGIGAHLSMETG